MLQNIWKIKNILFKAVPGIFISKLTFATKVPQACVFNSEEAITDWSWLLNQS